MRLSITCMQCLQESGVPSDEVALVELRDDGKYDLTCSRGHRSTCLLQQHRFEVLFEIGVHAILDGYYREAVVSFTASLERFYEFCIQALMLECAGSDTLFKECWSKVKHSERQLGAFIFLWAGHFKEAPTVLSTANVEFRNDVVHKGTIPTREEAVRYGDAILAIARPKLMKLRGQLQRQVHALTFAHLRDRMDSDSEVPVVTVGMLTAVSLTAGDASHHDIGLEQHLERVRRSRSLLSAFRISTGA